MLNPIQTLDIWVVGDSGLVLHFNGTAWSTQSTGTSVALHSVFAISVTDVIACGDSGVLMRLQNGNWSVIASGTSNTLHSVCGRVSHERVGCWRPGHAALLRWWAWQFRHPQLCTPWLGLVSMTSLPLARAGSPSTSTGMGEWKKAGCASAQSAHPSASLAARAWHRASWRWTGRLPALELAGDNWHNPALKLYCGGDGRRDLARHNMLTFQIRW